MSKQILSKLALERCGFYLSQLLAHVHLNYMDSDEISHTNANDAQAEESCIYSIISALRSDLAVLEDLIESR